MRLPAYTRDGKQCNECHGPVEWDSRVCYHFHTDKDADCLSGRRQADAIIARGEGHLLKEPEEA